MAKAKKTKTAQPKKPATKPATSAASPVLHRRRISWILLIITIPILGWVGWMVWEGLVTMRSLDTAKEALARADFETARAELKICLEKEPDSAEVNFLAGQAARRDGDLEEARRLLNRAKALEWPEEAIDVETALMRVQEGEEVLGLQRQFDPFLKERHPSSALILEVLVPALIDGLYLASASEYVEIWIELEPWRPEAKLYQGRLFRSVGRLPDAADAFQMAVELAPDSKEIRLELAQTLLVLNRSKEANEHFEQLLKTDPTDPKVRLGLASCRRLLGKEREARELLSELRMEQPNDLDVLLEKGKLDRDYGRPAQAEDAFRRVATQPPWKPEALLEYANILRRNGKDELADEQMSRHEEVKKDQDRLIKLYESAAAAPNDPATRYELGNALLRLGLDEKGVRTLERALQLDPNYAPAHQALAEYFKERNPTRADYHRKLGTGME